jgi:hypothetical protein
MITRRSWPALAFLLLMGCGPRPLPPELARPPACPDLGPAAAAALLSEAELLLRAGEGRDFEGALERAERLRRCQPDHEGLEVLEARLRAVAVEEADALVGAGRPGEARFQLARLAGPLDLGNELRELEHRMASSLADRALLAEEQRRWASAWFFRALSATYRGSAESLAQRDSALQRFLAHEALGVHLSIEMVPELQGEIAPRLGWDSRSWRWEPDPELAQLRGRLRVGPVECREQLVTSVASRPGKDEHRDRMIEQRRLAREELEAAEAALREQAEGQRRLGRAIRALDEADEQALEAEGRHPAVGRLLDARAALLHAPEPPAAEPFTYEVRTGTRTCSVFARLWFEDGGGEVFEPTISVSDSAHPAFLDQGLDEDPLRYSLNQAEQRDRLLDELVQGLAVTYEDLLAERWRAHTEALPEGPLSDDELERAVAAALLLSGVAPQQGEHALTTIADRVLGYADRESFALPGGP